MGLKDRSLVHIRCSESFSHVIMSRREKLQAGGVLQVIVIENREIRDIYVYSKKR